MRSVLPRILVLFTLVALAVPAATGVSAGAIPKPLAAAPEAAGVASETEPAGSSSVPTSSQDFAPVEVPGKRTATSRTFVMPDGSYQTELYPAPVHYQAPSGDWRSIDNTLVPTSRDRFVAENAANAYRLLVPADAGSAPVRVEADGEWVSFAAQGVDGAPRVDGTAAILSAGLGPNTRLEYQATNEGVKETIVLTAPPATPPAYVFDLSTSPGLTPRVTPEGGIDLRNAAGAVVFAVPAPFMTDSSGSEAGFSTDVVFDLFRTGDGWELTMTPDAGWLADPARVWPVEIDPTVTVFGQLRDTWMDQSAPNNAHAGGTRIRAGLANGNARRALVRFNLDGIPANADVSTADLWLFVDSALTVNEARAEYVARRVTRAWTDAATWNRYDGTNTWTNPGGDFISSPAEGTFITGGTSEYRNLDATAPVRSWVSGAQPNHGLIVKQAENVDSILAFYSANDPDPAKWPKLEVTYTDKPLSDRIGERRFFTFEEQALNDRMTLKVNVANGNLLFQHNDLTIAGTGLDASVQRFYNSLSASAPDPAGLTPGWVMGDAPTVRLDFNQPEPGRVVFVGPSGYRAAFDRNAAGGFARVEPGLDADLRHNDTANEYVLEWHDKSKFVFDEATGRLERREDKQGNAINYTYDPVSGRLDFLTDSQYDAQTNPDRKIDFVYDTDGLLDRVIDVAGGRTYDYTYARFPAVTGPVRLAASAVTSYDPQLGTDNVNLGEQTTYDYDDQGRLKTITDPIDPAGNVTRIGYVSATDNRVATVTRHTPNDPEVGDSVTTFSYVSDSRCATAARATRVNGERTDVVDDTTFCYDAHDRVVKTIDAQGRERSTEYTSNSNVVSFNESGVSGTEYRYSYNGDNLTQVQLPSGGTAGAAYGDSTNRHFPTAIRDFATASSAPPTWAYEYDDKGNLIKASHQSPEVTVTYFYCYDGKGQLQRIDPPGQNVTGPDENTTTGCGTDNQGNDTLLFYDPQGNLTQIDWPGSHGTMTFTYDDVSRIKTITDGRGVVTTFFYDALDHVTQLAYTGPAGITGVGSIDYSYDENGNLTARQDATGNTNFTYDELNRMRTEAPEPPSANTRYLYDEASNLKEITVPDETQPVRYTYNNLNLVTQVVDPEGRATTFGYNTRDLRTSTVYPNGVTMRTDYDSSRRINCTYAYRGTAPPVTNGCPAPATSLVTLFDYSYRSPSGLDTMTRFEEVNREGHTTTYSYDSLLRLVRARIAQGTTELRDYEYRLGDQGNIIEETVTAGTADPPEVTRFAYNSANELCWTAPGPTTGTCGTPPAGATSYDYDNAGNLTATSTGMSALYNLQNQTSKATGTGGRVLDMEYADATSDRRTRAGDRRMSYNQLGLATQATGSSGVPHTDWYVRDPNGLLVSRTDRSQDQNANSRDFFYIYDGLGSVAAVTGTPGTTFTRRYTYEPYGQQISPDPQARNADGITESDTNPWRYASGYYDIDTNMLKFGTRYYQPDVMRWTQMDPVAGQPSDPMTLNPYSYVGCDPINATDPSGRFFHEDVFEWEDAIDYALASVVGKFAGGATTVACWGVVAAFTGGIGLTVGTVACYAGGIAFGQWVTHQAEEELDE